MTEMSFQLPRAGYENLVDIIRGYLDAGADKAPVTVSSVAKSIAMKSPNISSNNKFVLSTEILERTSKGYKLTSDGLSLARVLDHFSDDTSAPEVQSAWEVIVEKNDFLQRVMTAVRVRGNMDTEAFARHIALTSGAPNRPQYMTGARTIITIFKAANKLVEDEDGTLKAVDMKSTSQDIILQPPTTVESRAVPSLSQQSRLTTFEPSIPLTVMVQITPATTDDELAELAQKVKCLVRLINADDEI
jgi:hypothetical protein